MLNFTILNSTINIAYKLLANFSVLNWNQKAKVLILPQTFALLIKRAYCTTLNQDLFLDLQRDLAPKLKKDSRDIIYL